MVPIRGATALDTGTAHHDHARFRQTHPQPACVVDRGRGDDGRRAGTPAPAGRARRRRTAAILRRGRAAATAGTLSLFDQSGERSAAIFYTAYVVNGAEAGKRPVTFVFNGGPGAASA